MHLWIPSDFIEGANEYCGLCINTWSDGSLNRVIIRLVQEQNQLLESESQDFLDSQPALDPQKDYSGYPQACQAFIKSQLQSLECSEGSCPYNERNAYVQTQRKLLENQTERLCPDEQVKLVLEAYPPQTSFEARISLEHCHF